jgi:hypothetical protein
MCTFWLAQAGMYRPQGGDHVAAVAMLACVSMYASIYVVCYDDGALKALEVLTLCMPFATHVDDTGTAL